MHSFIAQRILANTSHEVESRELIRRIITYYHHTFLQFGLEASGKAFVTPGLSSFTALTAHAEHIMDIGSVEGFIDFLTLFNTAELFNALYTLSYEQNDLSVREMLRFMEARRLCRTILRWFSTHYDLFSCDGLKTSPFEVQKKYFNGQMRALLRYKHLEEIDLEELEGVDDQIVSRVGFSELKRMIESSVDGGVEAVQEYYRLLKDDPDDHYFRSLSWPSSEVYTPRQKSCLDSNVIPFVPKIIAHTRH